MIDVRLVARTHYQVDEPATVAIVVRSCTSPVQSDFPDNVSRKLTKSDVQVNPAAARYAVDLTKSLGLLHDNLVWTNLGQLLGFVYRHQQLADYPFLTQLQKFFFLRIFLEFDGAALVFFAKKLEEDGRVPRRGESWADVAQALFRDTYDEYLRLATDPQDRVRIRQLAERRRAKEFRGRSGAHQCFVHLQTLNRLGLITRASGKNRVYIRRSSTSMGTSPTSKLLDLLPGAADLERAVSEGRLYDIVSDLLAGPRQQGEFTPQKFAAIVRRAYEQVISTGVNLCSLQTLTEAVQIESLALRYRPLPACEVLNRLRSMQRDAPRSIRFHVDVFGHPAFLKIS